MSLNHFSLHGLSIGESGVLNSSTNTVRISVYVSVANSACFTNKCADVWFLSLQLQYPLNELFPLSM